jgi:biopolymer transport protein ExbB/TolQ
MSRNKKVDINLRISKDLVKEAVCEKLERFQSLPMVMQTLENNNYRNDELHENIEFMMDAEFENIEEQVSEEHDPKTNPEEFKKAMEANSSIYKDNLKKIMKLMSKYLVR